MKVVVVSKTSDWSLFDRVAAVLGIELDGSWVECLDGADERYWDLEARGGKITMHLQHYLGISIYVANGLYDDHAPSSALLNEAYERLRGYDPG